MNTGHTGDPTPAFPTRVHFLLATLCFLGIAVYGSLVPFRFERVSLPQAIELFGRVSLHTSGYFSRTDWAANVLLFVPIGYCFLGTLALDRARAKYYAWMIPLVVAASAILSVLIEFAQIWFASRTPSLLDVVAQSCGTTLGIACWVASGPLTVRWLRLREAGVDQAQRHLKFGLKLYCLGLFIYAIVPLDLTLSPTILATKFREGRIVLRPFTESPSASQAVFTGLTWLALFLPIGMLTSLVSQGKQRELPSLSLSLLLGWLIAAVIVGCQLLVVSRTSTASQGLSALIGVALGVMIVRFWRGPGHDAPVTSAEPRRGTFCLALAAVYSLLLVIWFCAPLDLITRPSAIKAGLENLVRIPFVTLYQKGDVNAVKEILGKGLAFAPLGTLLTLAAAGLTSSTSTRRFLLMAAWLATAGLAIGIEVMHVFIRGHVPDLTDALICAAGAAAGMFITLALLRNPRGLTNAD